VTTDLLKNVYDAYRDYSAAIAALPEDMLTKPATIGTWSVRDIIAHVGGDEQWMAGQLEALQSGGLPTAQSCYGSDEPAPDGSFLSQDTRNAWQHERLRGLSLEEVREMAATSHARLLVAIESFSDEQLSEELTIVELGTTGHVRKPVAGERGWPLWEWLRGVTYQHYADHVPGLRAIAGR
jgi:hypothetical protein